MSRMCGKGKLGTFFCGSRLYVCKPGVKQVKGGGLLPCSCPGFVKGSIPEKHLLAFSRMRVTSVRIGSEEEETVEKFSRSSQEVLSDDKDPELMQLDLDDTLDLDDMLSPFPCPAPTPADGGVAMVASAQAADVFRLRFDSEPPEGRGWSRIEPLWKTTFSQPSVTGGGRTPTIWASIYRRHHSVRSFFQSQAPLLSTRLNSCPASQRGRRKVKKWLYFVKFCFF